MHNFVERQSKEEVRNLELKKEKELEKQIRRSRDGSVENKYQDYVRDEKDSRRSSRGEHDKDRYKDGASYKVKYGEDADRDSRHRDSKFREDFDWKKRHREDRHKDEYILRDHHSDRPGSKHTRDESYAAESRYKKSRYDDGEHTRYNDDRGNRAGDKEDQNYSRSRSTKDRHFDPEKKVTVSIMAEAVADKEGYRLRCADADLNASCNRERNSPKSYSHLSKDQSRYVFILRKKVLEIAVLCCTPYECSKWCMFKCDFFLLCLLVK